VKICELVPRLRGVFFDVPSLERADALHFRGRFRDAVADAPVDARCLPVVVAFGQRGAYIQLPDEAASCLRRRCRDASGGEAAGDDDGAVDPSDEAADF